MTYHFCSLRAVPGAASGSMVQGQIASKNIPDNGLKSALEAICNSYYSEDDVEITIESHIIYVSLRPLMIRIMKSATTATAAYESPNCETIEINTRRLVCTSPTGLSNEQYEEGDTSEWFNN